MGEPRVVLMNVATVLGERHVDLITRERWEAITAPFSPLMRGAVANLAAHNYIIYAVDGALLITSAYGAGEIWRSDNTIEPFLRQYNDVLFPLSADQKTSLRCRDKRAQLSNGSFVDRFPSDDGMWSLVHAGVFASPDRRRPGGTGA